MSFTSRPLRLVALVLIPTLLAGCGVNAIPTKQERAKAAWADVQSSPLHEKTGDFYHWHIEIIPKLTQVAGFEWGTGFYINPVAPEESAKFLREAAL